MEKRKKIKIGSLSWGQGCCLLTSWLTCKDERFRSCQFLSCKNWPSKQTLKTCVVYSQISVRESSFSFMLLMELCYSLRMWLCGNINKCFRLLPASHTVKELCHRFLPSKAYISIITAQRDRYYLFQTRATTFEGMGITPGQSHLTDSSSNT